MGETTTMEAPTLSDKAGAEREGESGTRDWEDADEQFTRVSASHISRCLTQEQVLERVKKYADCCHDYKDIKVTEMTMSDKRLLFNEREWELSSVAIGNLASFGGRALQKKWGTKDASPGVRALRAYYLRPDERGVQIFDDVSNDMLRTISNKSRALLRTYRNVGHRRIDAILTSRYGIIDNLWFLRVLGAHVANGRWCAWRFNGRTTHGHYFIMDEHRMEDSEFGGALSVGNSEVGTKSMTVRPSVFDWVSSTGVIFGGHEGEALRRVHAGKIELSELEESIQEHIDEQIPLFDACIQNLQQLKEIAVSIDEAKKIIVDVGDAKNVTKEEKLRWLGGLEAEVETRGHKDGLTAYGMVMGLSRAGHDAADENRDMELEALAGNLATPTRKDKNLQETWRRIRERAASLDDEKVEKLFSPDKAKAK